jgi:hypothetical protein
VRYVTTYPVLSSFGQKGGSLMSYINLNERYFLAQKLMRSLNHAGQERSLITSILNKFSNPDIILTAEEAHYLQVQINAYLDEAMERRDDYHIEFLNHLREKI